MRAAELYTGDHVPGWGIVVSVWFDAAGVLVTFVGGESHRWARDAVVS